MINIKLRMSIEQIIFNLLNKNAHTWVRYWQQKEMSGLTMPGEYIEIRTFFLSGIELSDFYNPQNEMFRLLGTKRSFSQNETFFFSHPYPPTLPFST